MIDFYFQLYLFNSLFQVKQKYTLITSKIVGKKLQEKLLELEFEDINILENNNYLPKRLIDYINKNKVQLFKNMFKKD